MRIDVQCHIFPKVMETYFQKNPYPKCMRVDGAFLCDFGSQKLALPDFQYLPETLLRMMDQGNVDISVISPNIPDPGFLPKEQAVDLCREANEATKETVDQSGGRFFGIGLLPWHAPEDAVKAVSDAVALDMKGVMLFSHCGELQVDDPSLEPVYDAIEKAGLPICLHPTIPTWGDAIGDYGMVATCSFVIDTGFALMRLCHSGILDRHPNLKVVMPHAGGIMPYLDGRLSYVPPSNRKFIDPNKRTVLETMFSDQVWYDLANPSKHVLGYFKDYLGCGRAMYATDYPFVEQSFETQLLEEMDFTDAEREQINWKNANALFRLGLE